MAQVQGGSVRPHVQAFADEVVRRFGVRCSTYEGHQPTRDRALDIFATREQGDAVCDFAQANWQHYGGDYWIWRQRIWNPPDRAYWRQMEDRGSVTANHFDHVHISFDPTAAAAPGVPTTPAEPTLSNVIKEEPVFMFGIPNNGGIWLAWNGKRYYLNDIKQVNNLQAKGVPLVNDWQEGAKIPVG